MQPALLVWGEKDLVFPMELAHRLNRFVDATFEILLINNENSNNIATTCKFPGI
jgi:pimeloyl-ACP methyl ester carboxylesterase